MITNAHFECRNHHLILNKFFCLHSGVHLDPLLAENHEKRFQIYELLYLPAERLIQTKRTTTILVYASNNIENFPADLVLIIFLPIQQKHQTMAIKIFKGLLLQTFGLIEKLSAKGTHFCPSKHDQHLEKPINVLYGFIGSESESQFSQKNPYVSWNHYNSSFLDKLDTKFFSLLQ